MKTILCYGDSLTWGYDPRGPGRHAYEDRWPSVLAGELGDRVRIAVEGLNGRTTGFDDHLGGTDRNGLRVLPTLLTTHAPLDLIIVMLGTNDLKPFICGRAVGARAGMQRIIEIVRRHEYPLGAAAPEMVVVAPPTPRQAADPIFREQFAGAAEEGAKLAAFYRELAALYGYAFFDAGEAAVTSPIDGIHLDAENTRAIGAALAPVVRKALGI
ncbi:SGNH/GDSL hydrolase family protein [Nitratireductor luteus]|uniref:SGNH/GDSL hydrolase family protein n=1 Tax=Nitratireductor luteus TaxID=2976980 RepID=UPI00223E99E9|nr:SGNH/GDSL hydrolase family protein [Nitratireductor luteus]